ncbi:MAG: hypothetical protein EOO41_00790 [Methanobacteriota archaeon]|nr:MAG: hypothetical protein EOO41_00790 [Euryarchaeota archaeon]
MRVHAIGSQEYECSLGTSDFDFNVTLTPYADGARAKGGDSVNPRASVPAQPLDDVPPAITAQTVVACLQISPLFEEVQAIATGPTPFARAKHVASGRFVRVYVNNQVAEAATALLRVYTGASDSLAPLIRMLKRWYVATRVASCKLYALHCAALLCQPALACTSPISLLCRFAFRKASSDAVQMSSYALTVMALSFCMHAAPPHARLPCVHGVPEELYARNSVVTDVARGPATEERELVYVATGDHRGVLTGAAAATVVHSAVPQLYVQSPFGLSVNITRWLADTRAYNGEGTWTPAARVSHIFGG